MNILIKCIIFMATVACTHKMHNSEYSNTSFIPSKGILLWPNATIPYKIDSKLTSKLKIEKAMKAWSINSPIKFVKHSAESHYVVFKATTHNVCSSQVGLVGGRQEILLGKNCGYTNILHEMGHLIGLQHEHNRPDASKHLELNLEAINPSYITNFKSWDSETAYEGMKIDLSSQGYGDYDIHSIMHYGNNAFSRCNKNTAKEFYWENPPKGVACKTMKALGEDDLKIGMHKQLTRKDRRKVKYLYLLKKDELFSFTLETHPYNKQKQAVIDLNNNHLTPPYTINN